MGAQQENLDVEGVVPALIFLNFFLIFCVPQLYLWCSPLSGEIFAYVAVF